MSDYLSHITWCADLRDLTDWDLFDCLRGSMSVPRTSWRSPDVVRERMQLIAEMDRRSFPPNVIEAAIAVGTWEGDLEAKKRREEDYYASSELTIIECTLEGMPLGESN